MSVMGPAAPSMAMSGRTVEESSSMIVWPRRRIGRSASHSDCLSAWRSVARKSLEVSVNEDLRAVALPCSNQTLPAASSSARSR